MSAFDEARNQCANVKTSMLLLQYAIDDELKKARGHDPLHAFLIKTRERAIGIGQVMGTIAQLINQGESELLPGKEDWRTPEWEAETARQCDEARALALTWPENAHLRTAYQS